MIFFKKKEVGRYVLVNQAKRLTHQERASMWAFI